MDRSGHRSLIERIRERKIVQWTAAYLSGAWLILQVVDVIGDQFAWPGALERGITITLGFGLLAAVIVAWYHGEKGHQRVTRTETLLLAAVLLFGAGALVGTIGGPVAEPDGQAGGAGRADASVPVDPWAVAVLPFAPATADSALQRLGRDLAVTLAATLDGIEELRTVDALTVLAHSPPDSAVLPLPRARSLAAELGAGRMIRGSLTRQGHGTRVDAAVYHGSDIVRASTTIPAGTDLGAVTDSVTLALVRQLWSRSSPELPSAAALATRSAEALRAYVEGEHALARGAMSAAVAAFERAFAHDSTYWFAYWRSLYPRVYEGSSADPEVMARIVAHRDEFPPADRRLVEAQMAATVAERLGILEETSRLFPTHWPAWYTRGNLLVHHAPYLGTSYREAGEALERVVALNPAFGSGWEHLFWLATLRRDSAAAARLSDRLHTFGEGGVSRFNDDLLTYYDIGARFATRGDTLPPEQVRQIAAYIDGYAGPIPAAAFGTGLLILGLPRATVLVANAVLDRHPRAGLVAGMWRGKAYGWAGRGAWDSAAVAIDRWVLADGSWSARLAGYGLMATGAALGAVDPAAADELRPADPPGDAGPEARAEAAWLEGVVAYAGGDTAAITAAREALVATDGAFLPLLTASLEALRLDARGQRDAAIRTLAAAEDSAANHFGPAELRFVHPHVSTVDRVLLGRWLREAGRPDDAIRFLSWNEAIFAGAPPLELVNRTVGLLGLYERARAEEGMGRYEDARRHYLRFVESVDRPVDSLRPLVEDGQRRLERLEPRLPG